MSRRRVVVTGLGLATPLGIGCTSFRAALRAGKSGVRTLHSFDPAALPVRIGAEVDDFDAKNYLDKKDRKTLKMMVRTIQLAVAGAALAVQDARLTTQSIDPTRLGVVFGTGTIPGEMAELGEAAQASWDPAARRIDWYRWGTHGMPLIPPMWMLSHVPNMPASHIAILNHARGPNNTITQSDAAGLLAVGEAARIIERGSADLMLTGGADTKTNAVSLVRYCRFSELSHRNDEPERASRPFERSRDGQVLGEGAGVLVLEELEHARRRQATILAEVLGFASGFDPGRTGRGLANTIRAALADARIESAALDHVNAHGRSTVADDAWEARGLHQTLGAEIPVLALKSYFGNLGYGSGAVELAGSIIALNDGIVPASLNYDNPDPACPVLVPREPWPVRRPCALKLSLTERGQVGAVIVRRWE